MREVEFLPYGCLEFPQPPEHRPYVLIDMVATIDGKIVTGERDEGVMDLGSPTDHAVMRQIESQVDAVLIGAETLRATNGIWYPSRMKRIVVSKSGRLPWTSRFFTDAPSQAFVATEAEITLPDHVNRLSGSLSAALLSLRHEHGVRTLLCEGGSELNAFMLKKDWVDELFLTVAPKVKLGRDVPTIADGEPLGRSDVQRYSLVELHRAGDEVFLRYRRSLSV